MSTSRIESPFVLTTQVQANVLKHFPDYYCLQFTNKRRGGDEVTERDDRVVCLDQAAKKAIGMN